MRIDNQNGTLANLLQTVIDQNAKAVDYQANTAGMEFRSGNGDFPAQVFLEGQGGEPTRSLEVNDVCFDGIAKAADIDVRTARRFAGSYPQEFDGLVNAIWQREPKNRLVRTFMENEHVGTARAFLSDRFKTFDNLDLLESAIPELMESENDWQVVNAAVTDKRLMARFKSGTIVGEGARVGDLMALGLLISNSETGHGSIQVAQINWTLACENGMQTENKVRTPHLTSSRGDADVWSVLSAEAKRADNEALALKLRDLVRNFASRESFEEILAGMRAAADDVIEGVAVEKSVDKLGAILGVPQKRRSMILEGLIETRGQAGYAGQPVSRATMMNAVTAVANRPDVSLDDVDDWQRLGGRVLNMSRADWNAVSTASLVAA